jgi:hypothetical protein
MVKIFSFQEELWLSGSGNRASLDLMMVFVELLQTPVANLGALPEVRTCLECCTKWAP